MYDVTVLGLGPVGSTAALFLAEAGLTVAAIERDVDVYKLPRAVNLDGEIVRAFQRIGRAEAVDSIMQTVRDGERAGFAGPDRNWLFGQDMRAFGSNGWQPNNMFDQPEFEQYLRDEALGHPNVTGFVGYEATQVRTETQNTEVDIESVSDHETQSVSGRYLIACDGASSFVRRALQIGSTNLGYDADWLVVDVTVNDLNTLTHDTLQVCDPDRITTYVCTKDPFRRWEFKMLPGETAEHMQDPDTVMSLIDPWTPRGSYTIRRTAVYQFHASIANTWRKGNTFIAGDAAHQTPPFLGQGMNAGMRDVINLAWKIPHVVRGVACDALLDTYQTERYGHAHDLIDWAVSIGKLMDQMTARFQAQHDGREPPPETGLTSSGYGQGRAQPPISQGIVCTGQVSDGGSTGHLFRQPIVERNGTVVRLDELLGPGFALVGTTAAIEQISPASQRLLERLEARTVALEHLKLVRGKFDRLFENADAAIVRPDRLVFGHTAPAQNLNDLVGELSVQMGMTN